MAMDRRQFLWKAGGGLGGIALAQLLGAEGLLAYAADPRADLNGGLHHRARAKRVVQFFMSGAASQVDTFDYKPMLIERDGQKFDPGGKIELFQSDPGAVFKSPWEFKARGQSGLMISELVPHIASCADDLALIRSMRSKSNVHGPATFMQNNGFLLPGFPSMGAWVTYGLGSLADNLPAFVVIPDSRGFAPNGPANWSAGFLPTRAQGTMITPSAKNPIYDLFPPQDSGVTPESEAEGLKLLEKMNRAHQVGRESDARLDARIASYEMAARLQLSAPEVLDISNESDDTKRNYGMENPPTEEMGRNCLIARRMLERGVRFIQVWSGADNGHPRRNWDSHEDLPKDHADMALSMDQPIGAFIKDLKARGLFEDTIIIWTTEFGRMPCRQGGYGRDHNPEAFTSWVAGGGFKGGISYGETDEWSYKVADKPVYCYDLHATVLHLLGIDHTRLTFRHNGSDRRLTDVHGEVISDLFA